MAESVTIGARHGPLPPAAIVSQLAASRRALVALSGGVDSSVVALLAHRALGSNAVAVTLTGPAVAADELASAAQVTRTIGIGHVVLNSDPLADARYAENPSNRCYFCRNHEGELLRRWGHENAIELYLDGVHLDDLGDDRPGLRAMNEHGFRHPLLEARWTKAEIRAFARDSGLPTWDRPSNACLASRVAHGQVITLELLDRVARAEGWLKSRGFCRVRVRVAGGRARVEVDPEEVPALQADLGLLTEALIRIGFTAAEIEPHGYRARSNA